MAPSLPVLHQFTGSHFNEKARWGLDWKGVSHRRVCYLPGPHAPAIRRLSGQTSTPVLEIGGDVVAGSARILAELEARADGAPLHPEDPAQLERALQWQRDFDTEVGPAVRTALFSVLIDEPDFLCGIFAAHKGALGRGAYRAAFPLVRGVMARAHDVHRPERVEAAFEISGRALDRVARSVGPSGQLVGDRFGVADLACAALLAPLSPPDHPDMRLPTSVPDAVQAFHARWAEHEAVAWLREQYASHRPAPACV